MRARSAAVGSCRTQPHIDPGRRMMKQYTQQQAVAAALARYKGYTQPVGFGKPAYLHACLAGP